MNSLGQNVAQTKKKSFHFTNKTAYIDTMHVSKIAPQPPKRYLKGTEVENKSVMQLRY